MVILDTNIIIDHLRMFSQSSEESNLMKVLRKEGRESLHLSIISIQELYEGKSTKKEDKLQQMLSILAPLTLLNYTSEIAELAGRIARDLKNPVEFADAAIAATCIFNDSKLFTLNTNHFEDIPNLELYNLQF